MTGLDRSDGLALELEHEAQHAVGRRVLRAHVDDHASRRRGPARPRALGGLGLGQAQHGTRSRQALGAGDDVGARELLGALGGALDGARAGASWVVVMASLPVTGWPGRP